jgi:anti-anti-sigma factor
MLSLQTRNLNADPEILALTVVGSVEISTLSQMENEMRKLQEEGHLRVVVDLAGLDYISSSGLGAFLGMVDHFRKGGGDLVFVGLTPKIHKIFSVVGFLRVLTVKPTVKDGVDQLMSQAKKPTGPSHFEFTVSDENPHSGEPFVLSARAVDETGLPSSFYHGSPLLKPSWGIVSPTQIGPFVGGQWAGEVILTGPEEVLLKISDGELKGEVKLAIREDLPSAQFPNQIICPGCRYSLAVESPDIFRCTQCNEIFMVDRWAHAISLRKGNKELAWSEPRVIDLTFPSDVNLLSHVRVFLTKVLKEEGYAEEFINDMEMSADEAITNIVEHAYGFDSTKTISAHMTLEKTQVTLVLRDQGTSFDPNSLPEVDLEAHIRQRKTGGLGRYLMKSLMDSVEYQSGPEGNTLCMVKKAQTPT